MMEPNLVMMSASPIDLTSVEKTVGSGMPQKGSKAEAPRVAATEGMPWIAGYGRTPCGSREAVMAWGCTGATVVWGSGKGSAMAT